MAKPTNEPFKNILIIQENLGNTQISFMNLPGVDSTMDFGNNSINRTLPIDFGGATSFDFLEFNFGGSGALGELTYTPVPEPSMIVLFGLGALGSAVYGWRRTKLQ